MQFIDFKLLFHLILQLRNLADAITELSTEATLTIGISKCLKDLKQQVRSQNIISPITQNPQKSVTVRNDEIPFIYPVV